MRDTDSAGSFIKQQENPRSRCGKDSSGFYNLVKRKLRTMGKGREIRNSMMY